MKNLKNLGIALNKAEQRTINGGAGRECVLWDNDGTVCLKWGTYWHVGP